MSDRGARHADKNFGDKALNEREFSRTFSDLFKALGYEGYHVLEQKVWARRTVIGFPDYVLWKPDRHLFCELKGDGGSLTVEQAQCLEELIEGGAEAYCFWPDQIEEIAAILRRR